MTGRITPTGNAAGAGPVRSGVSPGQLRHRRAQTSGCACYRPSRLDRSEARIPAGSNSARSFLNSASRGYISARTSAGTLEPWAKKPAPPPPPPEPVEPVKQPVKPGRPGRKVKGERPAGHRERQHPGVTLAEPLEHGHEGRRVVLADHLQRPAHGGLRGERHHVLVLPEAARAVDPVPVPDPVQRMEKRPDAL